MNKLEITISKFEDETKWDNNPEKLVVIKKNYKKNDELNQVINSKYKLVDPEDYSLAEYEADNKYNKVGIIEGLDLYNALEDLIQKSEGLQ